MNPDTTGSMSYSCVFYSHQFCDGTTESTDESGQNTHWADCACPCHQPDIVTKAA